MGEWEFDRLLPYIGRAIAMLTAIPFHEAAHAYVSYKLGDDTAKRYGRLSLNPLKHFDLVGALCLIVAGIGWAKPVPIGANRFRNPKLGMATSAAAGPISNVILAFICIIIYKLVYYATPSTFGVTVVIASGWDFLAMVLYYMMLMNAMLAVFNLIPVPPLDGSRIISLFLPQNLYFKIMKYERYSFIVFVVLVFSGVLDKPLYYMQGFLMNILWKATAWVDMFFV